jgi:colanic acid biosynthesis protein WcaH
LKRSNPTFLDVVRNTPLVSIDLVVHDRDGRILVGRRVNEPAKGTWFVPGGSIRKDETLAAALARISEGELGVTLTPEDVRFAGVYEHFYDTNFAEVDGVSTHYVVLAYIVQRVFDTSDLPADQHSAWAWLSDPAMPGVHPNTLAYLDIRPA